MRIDQFLKKTSIVKKRSDAKTLCDENLVKINGRYIKPSKTTVAGDLIEIETLKGTKRYKVLKIPNGNIKKGEITLYYEEC